MSQTDADLGYQTLLREFEHKARHSISDYQHDALGLVDPNLPVKDLNGTAFPRESIAQIRDSELPFDERLEMITHLLGTWYLDCSRGEWTYVPMIVNPPNLYLKFGVGVVAGDIFWNTVETARDILKGEDLSFIEKVLTTNIRLVRASVV